MDDGIQVTVDTDEFDYEEEMGSPEGGHNQVNSSSSKKSRGKQPQPGTSAMTEEELKLLQDNPHMQSIMNKLLDQRLKDLLPAGKSVMVQGKDKSDFGKKN